MVCSPIYEFESPVVFFILQSHYITYQLGYRVRGPSELTAMNLLRKILMPNLVICHIIGEKKKKSMVPMFFFFFFMLLISASGHIHRMIFPPIYNVIWWQLIINFAGSSEGFFIEKWSNHSENCVDVCII